jgi:hypothetical protein
MANAISVAMAMPTVSWRCFVSIDVAVEAVDLGVIHWPDRQAFGVEKRGYHPTCPDFVNTIQLADVDERLLVLGIC